MVNGMYLLISAQSVLADTHNLSDLHDNSVIRCFCSHLQMEKQSEKTADLLIDYVGTKVW